MYRLLLTLSFLVLYSTGVFAQNFLKRQVPDQMKYNAAKVIDEELGIEMYEPFNFLLGGDSVRECGEYACSGWVEDLYESEERLHKGYYIDGQLKTYKNYYPNGALERHYKVLDNVRSSMKKYYSSGQLKSDVVYYEDTPQEWTDYYPNGNVDYIEEYDKHFKYHVIRASYKEDGTPISKFERVHKRKELFESHEYYENGQLKVKGEYMYSENQFDVIKHGDWEYYDENGKLIKTEKWSTGQLKKTKNH